MLDAFIYCSGNVLNEMRIEERHGKRVPRRCVNGAVAKIHVQAFVYETFMRCVMCIVTNQKIS